MNRIPFTRPLVTRRDAYAVYKSLRTGWITRGEKVREMEGMISSTCGKKHTLCVDSATSGLELPLRFLGIGKGDEVITTPNTYAATADVIAEVGATIVFADIGYDYMLDPDSVRKLVTERTKAIIGVEIGGSPADFRKLMGIAKSEKGIYVPSTPEQEKLGRIAIIGDLAHSFGSDVAQYDSIDFVVFSFNAIKNITTGEGGSVSFNLWQGVYREMELLADHGQEHMNNANNWEYDIRMFGLNRIMTDQEAVLGMSQIKRREKILDERRRIVSEYERQLEGWCEIYRKRGSTCHLAIMRLPENVDKDVLARCLFARGVPVNVHYKPLPLMTAFRDAGHSMDSLPVAMELFNRTLTLPLYNGMRKREIRKVCDTIKTLLGAMR